MFLTLNAFFYICFKASTVYLISKYRLPACLLDWAHCYHLPLSCPSIHYTWCWYTCQYTTLAYSCYTLGCPSRGLPKDVKKVISTKSALFLLYRCLKTYFCLDNISVLGKLFPSTKGDQDSSLHDSFHSEA